MYNWWTKSVYPISVVQFGYMRDLHTIFVYIQASVHNFHLWAICIQFLPPPSSVEPSNIIHNTASGIFYSNSTPRTLL